MTGTHAAGHQVVSPAKLCLWHPSTPLVAQVSYHATYVLKLGNSQRSQFAKSGLYDEEAALYQVPYMCGLEMLLTYTSIMTFQW